MSAVRSLLVLAVVAPGAASAADCDALRDEVDEALRLIAQEDKPCAAGIEDEWEEVRRVMEELPGEFCPDQVAEAHVVAGFADVCGPQRNLAACRTVEFRGDDWTELERRHPGVHDRWQLAVAVPPEGCPATAAASIPARFAGRAGVSLHIDGGDDAIYPEEGAALVQLTYRPLWGGQRQLEASYLPAPGIATTGLDERWWRERIRERLLPRKVGMAGGAVAGAVFGGLTLGSLLTNASARKEFEANVEACASAGICPDGFSNTHTGLARADTALENAQQYSVLGLLAVGTCLVVPEVILGLSGKGDR